MRNSKLIFKWLIIAFFILYAMVAFVSTLHAISFFQLTNVLWLAVLLAVAYEIGQASVLFAILTSDNNKRLLPWLMMIVLTSVQVIGNVYASFKFIEGSGSNDWTYWQRSILFWLEADGPEMFKVVISWITGALLPLVALGMTSLVAENMKLREDQDKEKVEDELPPKEPFDPPTVTKVSEDLNKNSKVEGRSDNYFDDELAKEDAEYYADLMDNLITVDDEKESKDQKERERLESFAEYLLNNKGPASHIEQNAKNDPESGFQIVKQPFEIEIPNQVVEDGWKRGLPNDVISHEKDDGILSEPFSDPLTTDPNIGTSSEEVVTEQPEESVEIPAEEIDPEKLPNNPKGKKTTKKPEYSPRGWHLKRQHVDTNGDVYTFGKFTGGKAELPPEEQESKKDSSKKA